MFRHVTLFIKFENEQISYQTCDTETFRTAIGLYLQQNFGEYLELN